jgi:voltage-gated hydrogen channel 1
VEIPLTLWAFGWRFYDPLHGKQYGYHHTPFHLLDALVILGSFVSDVFLRGRERELASLIVLLRLWRLLKLVGGKNGVVKEISRYQMIMFYFRSCCWS